MQSVLPEDKGVVIDILTAAFLDNKSMNHVIKQDGYKLYHIRKLVEYAFETSMEFGKVLLSEDRKACALLIYPELKRATFKSVWLDLKLVFQGIGLLGALNAIRRENEISAVRGKERMAYLWFIGVEPRYQRFGLGKRLMQEIMISCKHEGRAIYLETSTLSNIAWYKKFGFEVYHELDLNYRLFSLRLRS